MSNEQSGAWQASPPPGADWPEEEWSVGRDIRLMHDVGGGLPLWDENGRLPEESDFVHGFLGLSVQLVADLNSWSDAVERGQLQESTVEAGKRLRERLAGELGEGFRVTFHP